MFSCLKVSWNRPLRN